MINPYWKKAGGLLYDLIKEETKISGGKFVGALEEITAERKQEIDAFKERLTSGEFEEVLINKLKEKDASYI